MQEYSIEKMFSKNQINKAIHIIEKENKSRRDESVLPKDLRQYWNVKGEQILKQIFMDCYSPAPMLTVLIDKANGKKREITIPATVDKMLQKVTAKGLYGIYEKEFSDNNFGFRSKRSVQDAVDKCIEYMNHGFEVVLKIDIENFFDTMDFDKLTDILGNDIEDQRIINWILCIIKTPRIIGGKLKYRSKGVSQGSPVSPCLANIYLNSFDKYLELEGIRFVRYADDIVIFFETWSEAFRLKQKILLFLEEKLALCTNVKKTYISDPRKLEFLGFEFIKKEKYRMVTSRKNSEKHREDIEKTLLYNILDRDLVVKLSQKNRGWVTFYRYTDKDIFLKEIQEVDRRELELLDLVGDNEENKWTLFEDLVLNEPWYFHINRYYE